MIHINPATFQNALDQIPLMDLYKKGEIEYKEVFNELCGEHVSTNVDGVYFPSYNGYHDFEHLQLFNNGSIELQMDLEPFSKYIILSEDVLIEII